MVMQIFSNRLSRSLAVPLVLLLARSVWTAEGQGQGPPPERTIQAPGAKPGRQVDSDAVPTITIDSAQTYQTIIGWEATAQAGQDASPHWDRYKDALFDQAVNDLGITRLRVEIKSPATGAGFDLARFDSLIARIAVPMKKVLAARGESLWVNVCVVGKELKDAPAKYAEEVVGVYQHMQRRYGFVPDSWEVSLEPDSVGFSWDTPQKVARAMIAAGDMLRQAHFRPYFVVPSCTSMARTPEWFDQIMAVPGAQQYVQELAYHRYVPGDPVAIANRTAKYRIHASMLEHIGSGRKQLHADLKQACCSAWEQYCLAFPTKDNGAQYYVISEDGRVALGQETRVLRQYFRFIRPGAVRIESQSSETRLFDPVAFINRDGSYVVVMIHNYPGLPSKGEFVIRGLPAGKYGIKYSSETQYDRNLSDQTIAAGQELRAAVRDRGVVTVYGKKS